MLMMLNLMLMSGRTINGFLFPKQKVNENYQKNKQKKEIIKENENEKSKYAVFCNKLIILTIHFISTI